MLQNSGMQLEMNDRTDIILKSDESSSIPKWTITMPTQALMQKGLTSKKLRREIKDLNESSELNTGCLVPRWLGFIAVLAGFVIFLIPMVTGNLNMPMIMTGMILLIAGGFSTMGLMRYRIHQIAKGFELTRQNIELDLNTKYQPKGIRWSVIDEQRMEGYSNGYNNATGMGGGYRTYTKVIHHILISSVNVHGGITPLTEVNSYCEPEPTQKEGYY